jgi:hypothetical protein
LITRIIFGDEYRSLSSSLCSLLHSPVASSLLGKDCALQTNKLSSHIWTLLFLHKRLISSPELVQVSAEVTISKSTRMKWVDKKTDRVGSYETLDHLTATQWRYLILCFH